VTTGTTERLKEAAANLQGGDAARALAIAQGVADIDPDNAEALHLVALSRSRLGDVDRAVAAFEAAAALHPRRDIILVNLGNHLRQAGRPRDAADAYERAVAAAPTSAAALSALGAARALLGEHAAALDAFSRALKADPQNLAALIGLGNVAVARGRDEQAEALFSKAISASPQSSAALINRGAAFRRMGRLEESLADLDRAVGMAVHLAEASFQRAATLRAIGRFDDAAAAYQAAIASGPLRTDIHREYAAMMFEIGRSAEAFDQLDAILAARPSAALMTARGEVSLLAGDVPAAADAARRALALNADDALAFGVLARAERLAGAMQSALISARRSVDLAPDDFALLHLCCEIEMAADHASIAARRLERSAPEAHLQKHIALKAIAMRLAGDPRYQRYYDYDRLTAQVAIEPPPGFATIADFNAALLTAIAPLHRTKQRPLDQTLFGGTQSPGRLWNEPDPVIRLFAETMLAAARKLVAQLPDDSSHPFLARKSTELRCAGAWSVMLSAGGGHVDHIHPAGWISASYYVQSPPEIFSGDRAGFLRLGASGVAGVDLPPERYFPPTPGTVVFFPSYVWHGVERFEASSPRVTAPFDLSPSSD